MGDWEQKNLANELTRGKELATKLQSHLMNNASSSSWLEAHEFLVQRIIASNEKALSMLNSATSIHFQDQEDSNSEQDPQDAFKKRRINPGMGFVGLPVDASSRSLPRWTRQVRLERLVDDGFAWRKYGQKEILGAKYPRSYFRCVHKYDQGCSATKQVQKSQEDPPVFETTYYGSHTCTYVSHNNNVSLSISPADQRQQPQTANQHQQQQSPVLTPSNSSAGQAFSDVTVETSSPFAQETPGTDHFSDPENAETIPAGIADDSFWC